jgi:hypothetical protein
MDGEREMRCLIDFRGFVEFGLVLMVDAERTRGESCDRGCIGIYCCFSGEYIKVFLGLLVYHVLWFNFVFGYMISLVMLSLCE